MFKGIDVSHHNGVIDWRKVKASGIEFAVIRAGFGWDPKQIDKKFIANITNALRFGVECGAYWFSYATTAAEARLEAKLFLKTIAPYRLSYPIAFDYEYDSVDYAKKRGVEITAKLACEIADAFMSICANAGYYIVNYTNNDFLARYFTYPNLKQYEVWLAKWIGTKEAPINKPINVTGIWQNYVGKAGTVDGIKGEIDMDLSFKDYPVIIRAAGLNHLSDKPVVFAPVVIPPAAKPSFKEGDIVKVLKPIIYGTTKRFVMFCRDYDVIGTPKGDRVVIGKKGRITAAVAAENLEKLK